MTASCKAFPSYQGRAAETASSIVGFLIERLEVLLCSLHETQHFREVTQGPGVLVAPGVELAGASSTGRGQAGGSHQQVSSPQ